MTDTVRDAIAAELALLTREVRTPSPPLGYGVDLSCVDDITPGAAELDPFGTLGIAQGLYHRLTTHRGSLPDDPDYGLHVADFLHAGLTERDLSAISGQIIGECQKDDRVADATCEVTLSSASTLRIKLVATPVDPTLEIVRLVLAVTSAEVLIEAIDSAA